MNSFFETLRNLGPVRLLTMAGVVIGFVAFFAYLVTRLTGGEMSLLYSNLDPNDSGRIVTKLESMAVPYELRGDGTQIYVPSNRVLRLRMTMAANGMPSGGSVGYKLFNHSDAHGNTSFGQNVNLLRALEGELARSIQSISVVQSARVHLAIPKPSVFVREQRAPTASAVLNLRPGRTLDSAQVSGIVHLLSSSVTGLQVKNVTVLDQNGNLLTSQDGSNVGLDPSQFKYRREVEQSFVKRIEAILAPITGPNNVLAQVTADMDFTQSENVAEIYGPNQSAPAAVLSKQTSESSDGTDAMAGGGPGIPAAGSHCARHTGAPTLLANPGRPASSSRSPAAEWCEASLAICSISPGGRSSALPISRTAERRRYVGNEQTSPTCSAP